MTVANQLGAGLWLATRDRERLRLGQTAPVEDISRLPAKPTPPRFRGSSLSRSRVVVALAISILVLIVFCASSPSAARRFVLTGQVVSVSDGDTLSLLTRDNRKIRVRLAEVDAPESGQPWGAKSKKMLSGIVYRKEVRVVVTDTDRYGRSVGRVYLGTVYVNAEIVKRGGAWAFTKYLRDLSIPPLEAEAKRARRGLWAMPPSQTIPPWDWRANQRSRAGSSPVLGLVSSAAWTG